jgi:hypothetical protein
VKTPIQTTSRKCQNMDRHMSRRWFSATNGATYKSLSQVARAIIG